MRQTSRVLGAIAALTVSAPAFAGILELSDFSSDSTPASELSAVLDFSLAGTTLTLSVTNDSLFDITDIYFNSGDPALTLTPMSANFSGTDPWVFAGPSMADGFGTFDHHIMGGNNSMNPPVIIPTATVLFVFEVPMGTTMGDLVSDKSVPPPPDRLAKAAAKFQSGPNGDSAFGACIECDGDDTTTMIPLPSAAGMGLLGLGGLALSRRRRDSV